MQAHRTHVITLIHRDIDHNILLTIHYCLISTTKTVTWAGGHVYLSAFSQHRLDHT